MNLNNCKYVRDSVRNIMWDYILKNSLARKCLAYFPIKEGKVGRLGRKKPYIFPANNTLSSSIGNLVINEKTISHLGQIINCLLAHLDIINQEEKIFKNLLDNEINVTKNLVNYKEFNFDTFLTLMSSINKPDKCLMSCNVWSNFSVENTKFSRYFNPALKYNQVLEGYMGDLLGISIYTDIFKVNRLRVLKDDEVYMLPTSIKLGGITQKSILKVDLQEGQEFNKTLDVNYNFNVYCIEGLGLISDQVAKAVKAV